ncbi:MAG: hypothetical protein RIR45_1824, partial [Pseudomonadota bacterium]
MLGVTLRIPRLDQYFAFASQRNHQLRIGLRLRQFGQHLGHLCARMRFDSLEHHGQLLHIRSGVDNFSGHDDVRC